MAVSALKGGAEDYITKRQDYLTRLPTLLENTLTRFRATASRYSRALRVLYAEHHPADIDLTIRHMARHAPHVQLEVVNSAAEVLRCLADPENTDRFDLLLLDYRLPGMNALDLLKELEYRDALKLPVVLVTGQGDEEVAVQALRLGITDYLVKNPGYLFQLPRTLENTYAQAPVAA
jgi:DNA-binding NtrC family response regulator